VCTGRVRARLLRLLDHGDLRGAPSDRGVRAAELRHRVAPLHLSMGLRRYVLGNGVVPSRGTSGAEESQRCHPRCLCTNLRGQVPERLDVDIDIDMHGDIDSLICSRPMHVCAPTEPAGCVGYCCETECMNDMCTAPKTGQRNRWQASCLEPRGSPRGDSDQSLLVALALQ
jgi:hypothetical protein